MTACCRISTLELSCCGMKGQHAESLVEFLTQCPALVHRDLSGNHNFRSAETEWLSGVLGQCRELVHLNLWDNQFRAAVAASFAGVLVQCPAMTHLNLCNNWIGAHGAEILAGVLCQFSALAHLDLSQNWIKSFAGVLVFMMNRVILYQYRVRYRYLQYRSRNMSRYSCVL